jgi:hypothetical protein
MPRRKLRATGQLRLDELPEDILIIICCHCRIDELFSLRLTSSYIRDLISERIATIAPSVARSTFPLSDLLLEPLASPSCYTIEWLKGLIPLQLASILVDRHRFTHEWGERYGIPAEDAYGNDLRARVTNGWRVLRRLSKISEEVYQLPEKMVLKSPADLAWKVVHPTRFKFEVFEKRENLILTRRLQYINSLSNHMVQDYKVMFMLLSSVFRSSIANQGEDYTPWIFDWGNGIDCQRLLRRGTSWLTWFILQQGPDLFWHQWWILPPDLPQTKNHIRDKAIQAWFGESKVAPERFIEQVLPKEWSDVNEKWHNLQRSHATQVHRTIEKKAVTGPADFNSINPISYFTLYAEAKLLREQAGIAPVRETLSHVPFYVDFRCPEELFQKACAVQHERAVRLVSQPRNG